MENKNKVLLTVISVATLLVAVVGATFAYFSSTTDQTETQSVETGSSSITMETSTTTIKDLRPTTFDAATISNNDSNINIAKVTLTMGGNAENSGTYKITMTKPSITIGSLPDNGTLADLQYAVYQGSTKKSDGTFSTAGDVVIVDDGAYVAGEISGTYTVYVWIKNADADQNNLQELDFDLDFSVSAISDHA